MTSNQVLRRAILPVKLTFVVLALTSGCNSFAAETDLEALTRATVAMQAAVPRAQNDPARPIFHVTSPAQWVNDPNGPIFYKGYYHIFYQLDPFTDKGGIKYWGHVRSRDLAKWEHLPIAIAPSNDKGEESIWSGCCTINGKGQPMIFYTSIAFGKSPMTHSEQWAATSDDNLIHWQKSQANPVLSEELHGDRKIYDWRDPFVFHHKKRTFMVLGGSLNESKGGQAVVNIYEAENAELTKWKYRGVLFQHPDANARTSECPNFFQLGNQWVLFVSPYGKVQYFIGEFDPETCRFHSRTRGLLDNGPNFYAPNTMLLANGRRLVWGWVTGFRSGPGWNGCLTVPRELSISRDGQLKQIPAPQLAKLRGISVLWRNVRLENEIKTFNLPSTGTLEILTEVDLKSAKRVTLEFKRATGNAKPIIVSFDGETVQAVDSKAILQVGKDKGKLKLQIFFDRSVMEIFANDSVCFTKTIPPLDANSTLNIKSDGGSALCKSIQVWLMNTIW